MRIAPVSGNETKARIRETIAAAAERAKPMIEAKDGSITIAWPRADVTNPRLADDFAPTFGPVDIVGLLAWLDPERLMERLEQEVDARFPGDGLSDSERSEKLAELEAELLAAERREEAIIGMAREGGANVSRRAHADPRAVLNVV